MSSVLTDVIKAVSEIVRDKETQVTLAVAAFLSSGHVLIEDTPGTGKTSMARALGHHLNLDWKRLQCTNDTMPSDIFGVNIFDPNTAKFTFRQGPLFTQLLLVDELNRAPSKSQSALLEAMAERQVSIDGKGYILPTPFLMIATQNPSEQVGVSKLPESQLDRFTLSFSLGLPSPETEAQILRDLKSSDGVNLSARAVVKDGEFKLLQERIGEVETAPLMIAYLQKVATHIRQGLIPSLSVRALMQIKDLAQSMAVIDGRNYIVPEDIQAVLVPALRHRMPVKSSESEAHLAELTCKIAVP